MFHFYFRKMKKFLCFFIALLLIAQNDGQEITSVCSICDCKDSVVDCRNSKLEASFVPEAWKEIAENLTFKEAKLDNNRIGHVTRFPTLPFTRLSLRNNVIVKIDEMAFKNLTSLVYLDLSRNELTSDNLLPNVFEVS